jgi:hypothetical protein
MGRELLFGSPALFLEKLAGFSIDEVQPRAGWAGDNFVLVVQSVIIYLQPTMNPAAGLGTGEHRCYHLILPFSRR